MTASIDRETFAELAGDGPAVVRVDTPLDVDIAPLQAYATLSGRTDDRFGRGYAYLLESAEKVASSDPDGAFDPQTEDRHARYSFVGYDPVAVVTISPDGADVSVLAGGYDDLIDPGEGDVLDRLRGALPDIPRRGFPATDRPFLDGGLVGFLAYDAVYDLWLEEVGLERPDSRFPDAQFLLATRTLVFDHVADEATLVATPIVRASDDPTVIYNDLAAEVSRVEAALADASAVSTGGFRREDAEAGPREEYERAVRRAKEHVLDGDIYQGVISRTRELVGEIDALGLYDALRAVNPSPYMYLLGYDDLTIVGASPETLVSVGGPTVTANPIAGTCPRGESPVEDRRLAGEMLADEKERAEHTMLVDLARNDVRRVAQPGSVRVEEFMSVRKYSHVQHIESSVSGRIAADSDAFDATRAAFPAGTLTGAPKIRAMEIIDDLERDPRGPYGGGVGYVSWTGDADFAIVIRTATVEHGVESVGGAQLDRITVRAGGGLVADSDPPSEYEETEQKMDGVLAAIDRIEQSEGSGTEEESAPAEEAPR